MYARVYINNKLVIKLEHKKATEDNKSHDQTHKINKDTRDIKEMVRQRRCSFEALLRQSRTIRS